jgi:hypothetical protein
MHRPLTQAEPGARPAGVSSRSCSPHLPAIAEPSMARWHGRRRTHFNDGKEPSEDPPSNQPQRGRRGETRQEPGELAVVARSKQRKGHRRHEAVAKPRTDPQLFHDLTPARLRRRSRATLSRRSRAPASAEVTQRRFGGRGKAAILKRPTRRGSPPAGGMSSRAAPVDSTR